MFTRKARAYAPGHITGFFYLPKELEDVLSRQGGANFTEMSFSQMMSLAGTYHGVGSVGAGFSIDSGITTEAVVGVGGGGRGEEAELSCFYNKRQVSLEALDITAFMVKTLLKAYLERENARHQIRGITLHIETPLPLKAGFGLSGAAALTTAFALSSALELGLMREEIASLAHFADCYFKGGLGDVAGQLLGGFEQRKRAGLPDTGEIVSLPLAEDEAGVVFLVSENELRTKRVLADREKMGIIRKAGREAVERFGARPTLRRFFEVSYVFSQKAHLIPPHLQELLETLNSEGDCQATLAQLGNTVVAAGNMETIMTAFRGRGRVIQGTIAKNVAGIV